MIKGLIIQNAASKNSFDINPLEPGVVYLYPLKTLRFSDVLIECRLATLGCNGLSTRIYHETIIPTGTTCKKNPLLYARLSLQVAHC